METLLKLQVRYIPPDRSQFYKDREAFARIIGSQYYVKGSQGSWLRVEKETFEERVEFPPLVALALKEGAFSPEDIAKVRNLREIHETGITIIGGQSCRLYESKITLDKESPPYHVVSRIWVTVKDNLPIRIVVRGYEGDSTDPVGILTMTFDYKTKFTIPTPVL